MIPQLTAALPPSSSKAKLYAAEESWRERLHEAHAAAGRWQVQVEELSRQLEKSEQDLQQANAASQARQHELQTELDQAMSLSQKAQERCEQHVALIAMVQSEAAAQRHELVSQLKAEREQLPKAIAEAVRLRQKERDEALATLEALKQGMQLSLQQEIDAVKEAEAARARGLEDEVCTLKRELAKGTVARR